MSDAGYGLQMVDVTKAHKYLLDEEELKRLLLSDDIKDLPVVVVSVAGAYRGGKSFLLNFFIRYLMAPKSVREDGSWLSEDSANVTGFTWKGGIKPVTSGLLMWSQPFIISLPSGDQVAVLLVDTQGNFDGRSSVKDNSTIFALSTLLSSVQIYNISHDVSEDHLQHLGLFTQYGKLAASKTGSKAFQVLEVLVRDWQFADQDYPYGAVGGEKLLQEKLEVTSYMSQDMKDLREQIKSSFDKLSCFLMPHPGFAILSSTYDGNIKDISLDFRNQLKVLVNSIFSPEKLLTKKVNGQQVKAKELFNYFKTYVDLFNSDKIPTPQDILSATVKAGLLSAVGEAKDEYEKSIEAKVGPTQPGVPAVDLKDLHQKSATAAIEFYKNKPKLGTNKEVEQYKKQLEEDLKQRLPQLLQSNLAKIQAAINESREAYEKAVSDMNNDKPICVHAKDVDEVHQRALNAALQTYDRMVKRLTNQYDGDRIKFIESFQKQKDLLHRENERNNTLNVTLLKMEYWQQMQQKATQEATLSSVDFENEHKMILKQILKDFDAKRTMPNQKAYTEDVYKYQLSEACKASFDSLKVINKSKNKEAMTSAIAEYDQYMGEFADMTSQCMHPDDLQERQELAVCRALTTFHPLKECSDGFNTNDEDELTLNEILQQRFNDYKKNNEEANETAVLLAFNMYVDEMEDKCRFSLWWLLVIPYLINLESRSSFHEAAKEKAYEKFYGQRREGGYHSSDPYKDRLNEMILNKYNEAYNH